ncbi:MAG: putative acyl-CoA ligase [Gammaproteobacteria bacterium]|nr:acyl-CoA synthetase [Gammaproteobacteria bacterium]GIK36111.1 MAG: putative acyl-CoA ligase [Gammaproteobacteria bacterium]
MYPGIWARKFPQKAAFIDAASGATVSYGEFDARSNRLAQLMWQRGLRPGGHVALFMENDLRFFEGIWAALRSGLYVTPINRYLTAEEAAYILNDCEAQLLVASGTLAGVARELPRLAPRCHTWLAINGAIDGYEDYEAQLAAQPAQPLAAEPEGRFMLYSSGTTGRPKGILRPLSGLPISEGAAQLAGPQRTLWGFDEDTVFLSTAPLYHSAPTGFGVAATVQGGTVVVMPRFEEIEALRAIERFRITHSQWVPTMFVRLLKRPLAERSGFDLSSHRVAVHGAAPCPVVVKQQMIEWWGPILYEYYSGSELHGLTHCDSREWLAHPGTVGKAVMGILHVCDEEGRELPPGESGLVYFEQSGNPFEYHKDADKTRSARHPQHGNWSALGDVGHVDADGFLYLTDRATFMIISGGVNIYPQEIEDRLVLHPAVADVAVFGVPDPEMGEAVKAVVQAAPGATPGDALAAELIGYAREHLAHYKCPRSIDFVDELPRLPTGKLYKRILRDRYWGNAGSRIV